MTIITGLIFAHKIIGLSIGMLIADLGITINRICRWLY